MEIFIMYDGTSCLIYSKLGVKQFEGTTEYEIKRSNSDFRNQ